MRAILCRTLGSPRDLVYGEAPAPEMAPGCVRIRVRTAGVNFADTLIIRGQYQRRPDGPFSPGLETAGEVIEVAPDVAGFKPGDRVMAVADWGGFAQEMVVPAVQVWPVPDTMSDVEAGGFPIIYGTSHLALTERARLRAGETLLVHGAAGGVGLAAVEIGKKIGATVIAVAGGADKLAVARRHGADHVLDHGVDPIRERVKELTGGRGADVVFDPVGGNAFDTALRCIAWDGRIVIIGFASGLIPQVPANILLVKHISVMGFYWGSYRIHAPERVAASMREVLSWYGEGALRPEIAMTLPLARAAEALEALIDRKVLGKIVLTTES